MMTITCPRCDGTGQHSYHPTHGSICFRCKGQGVIVQTAAQARAAARRAVQAAARAETAAQTAENNRRQSENVLDALRTRYADRLDTIAHIDAVYHGQHLVEWFRSDLRRQGIRPASNFVGDLVQYL